METTIEQFINMCQWDTSSFLIFSDNVFGKLIYYSHFLTLILSLLVGFFVFFNDRKSLVNRLLFFVMLGFSTWVFFDLILWANEKPPLIMFFWSLMLFVEPLIYALCLYFVIAFVNKKDINLYQKIGIFSLLIPVIVLLPTQFSLIGFDLSNCYREPIEGFLATYYVYFIEIIYVLSIVIFSLFKYKKSKNSLDKKQIIFVAVGTILFLISLVSANIVGSITENWTLAQVGLFGMPIFAGFLAYMTIKFKAFNLKLFSAQILVFALGFLVLAIAFVRNIDNVKLVVACTLLFVFLLGKALIKSVRNEVEQRERLEQLRIRLEETNVKLGDANDKLKDLDKLKTEFLSLASHQLRSPLTAIKGYASMLADGDFGKLNVKAKDAVTRIFESSKNLTIVVEDFLNVSKIESGGMQYQMENFDLGEMANNMVKDLSMAASNKGLAIDYKDDNNAPYAVNADKEKIRQIVLNFIDNSIKYTKAGEVKVSVVRNNDKIVFAVKDTGMGMTPQIKASLFQKFARGDGARMNTTGSGLGLYLAKEIVEAHKGRVWVESEGMGKGSAFYMELNATKA